MWLYVDMAMGVFAAYLKGKSNIQQITVEIKIKVRVKRNLIAIT